MTTCIAVICDYSRQDLPPAVVFCADRLVSAGIQFESGTPKIKPLTNYCYAMQSSNDSLTSDMILETVKQKIASEQQLTILQIVEKIRDECYALKKQYIEDNILFKYNLTFENLESRPESIVKDAVNEVRDCQYPYSFSFIVFGLEPPREVHLYVIDQDGQYWLQDSLGFATIGSGGNLAFLELTKYEYNRNFFAVMAIPRVYFAKKVSERAEGVGRHTDLAILFFNEPQSGKFEPRIQDFSQNDKLIPKLDEVYASLVAHEKDELMKLSQSVLEILAPKAKSEPTPKPEDVVPST